MVQKEGDFDKKEGESECEQFAGGCSSEYIENRPCPQAVIYN